MGIKECFVSIFAKLFLNTNLPCNEYLKDSIKTNMRTDCEIVERNDEHIVIAFPFKDMPITIQRPPRSAVNGITKWFRTMYLKKKKKNLSKHLQG